MTEEREHLERLISERPDGALTPEETEQVRRAVAEDAEIASAARQYEKLQAVLSEWRTLPLDVDWRAYAERVSSAVVDAAEQQASAAANGAIDPSAAADVPPPTGPRLDTMRQDYRAVDELVRDHAAPPDVDWDRFKARVSAAVRKEAATDSRSSVPRRSIAGWVARIGAPLAAAAALAVLIWWPREGEFRPPTGIVSAAPIIQVAVQMPRSTGFVSISVDERPGMEDAPAQTASGGFAFASGIQSPEPLPAFDEAVFY
jgi:hypothetical protein